MTLLRWKKERKGSGAQSTNEGGPGKAGSTGEIEAGGMAKGMTRTAEAQQGSRAPHDDIEAISEYEVEVILVDAPFDN